MVSGNHDRLNNFDAIRLLGAFLVLVGHAYPLHGRNDYPVMWNTTFSTLGIMIFFSVSGYLIATSWNREPKLRPYLQKRALRIFPGLIALTLGTIFVLGPVMSTLAVGEYFASSATWTYLSNAILWPSYGLPGVFQSVPYVGTVNGSLWSLPIEFACYLMVPLVSLVPARLRAYVYGSLGIGFSIAAPLLTQSGADVIFYGSSLVQALTIWPFFMFGAAIASAGSRVPLRLDAAFVLVIAASLLTGISPLAATYAWVVVLPYAIIAFGSARTPIISRLGRFGDFSYGLYLYAFPVQQVVIAVAPELPFALSIVATTLITSALAFASWHLVEKQALKLKPKKRSKALPPQTSQLARA